jgi:hypothetical protein
VWNFEMRGGSRGGSCVSVVMALRSLGSVMADRLAFAASERW